MHRLRTDMSIPALLEAVTDFYSKKAPFLLEGSCSFEAAMEDEIRDFGNMIGTSLPADYREFLLLNTIGHPFADGFNCNSLQRVAANWRSRKQLLDEGKYNGLVEKHEFNNWTSGIVKKCWWNTKWIPIANDGTGHLICIDLDPGPQGIEGQILVIESGPWGDDQPGSFRAYLAQHLYYLESGKFKVSEDYGLEVGPNTGK